MAFPIDCLCRCSKEKKHPPAAYCNMLKRTIIIYSSMLKLQHTIKTLSAWLLPQCFAIVNVAMARLLRLPSSEGLTASSKREKLKVPPRPFPLERTKSLQPQRTAASLFHSA